MQIFMLSLPEDLWPPIQATDCLVRWILVRFLQTGICIVKKADTKGIPVM